MNENDKKKRLEAISVAKAFALATSSGVMIITFVVVGYFIGKIWGSTGAGIGIVVGGILGIISLANEIYYLYKYDIKKKEGKK